MAVSATHEKMQDRYAGRRLTIGSFALLLVLTACGVDESEHPEAPPCEPPAQEVVLGSPKRNIGPSEISTTGGELWAKLGRGFEIGPFEVSRSLLWIGEVGSPAEYDDEVDSDPNNASLRVDVIVGRFTAFDLPAGRYWQILHGGGNLLVVSCRAGVLSDALSPVADPDPRLVPVEIRQ